MSKITKKYITPIALFSVLALLGWGCRKDVVEIRPYPVSIADLTQFLTQVPDPTTLVTFSFNGLSQDKVLEAPNGVRVFLSDVDQLFANQNSPTPVTTSTCSDLRIELSIAASKGDILARNMPTITTNGQLLESGGMVGLRVFCGTTELQLLPGRTIKIQLPANETKDNMKVYVAKNNSDGFLGWENSGQEVFKADWPNGNNGTQKGYEVIISHLGWSNCARQLPQADVSPFCINLEPGYTGLNTKAFLVFEHLLIVAPMVFDDATRSFCFPNVPAGYPVRGVSIAKLGPDYWLGYKTTESGTNTTLPLQLLQEEEQQVLGYLRGL